jgi:hypothetical protein
MAQEGVAQLRGSLVAGEARAADSAGGAFGLCADLLLVVCGVLAAVRCAAISRAAPRGAGWRGLLAAEARSPFALPLAWLLGLGCTVSLAECGLGASGGAGSSLSLLLGLGRAVASVALVPLVFAESSRVGSGVRALLGVALVLEAVSLATQNGHVGRSCALQSLSWQPGRAADGGGGWLVRGGTGSRGRPSGALWRPGEGTRRLKDVDLSGPG